MVYQQLCCVYATSRSRNMSPGGSESHCCFLGPELYVAALVLCYESQYVTRQHVTFLKAAAHNNSAVCSLACCSLTLCSARRAGDRQGPDRTRWGGGTTCTCIGCTSQTLCFLYRGQIWCRSSLRHSVVSPSGSRTES